MQRLLKLVLLLAASTGAQPLWAKPFVPKMICEGSPDLPACAGKQPSCSYCHAGGPPALNTYGSAIQQQLSVLNAPLAEDPDLIKSLLEAVGDQDSDGDGALNKDELAGGSLPAQPTSLPGADACAGGACQYDYDYVYKKIWLSVCGEQPTYEDYLSFSVLAPDQKAAFLDQELDDCMQTEHWRGKDGVVWEIAHYKIRPIGNLKLGEDAGVLPIVDYYSDYNLFVYTQIDGHDARDILLADYTVDRKSSGTTSVYTKNEVARLIDGEVMQPEYRVGLLTTFWNLSVYLNYTGIARVLVAQAFNAYLGVNLALMQGLDPAPVEDSKFMDYDQKGVSKPECAGCHTTIDPLAYPFRNYNGLTGTGSITGGQVAPFFNDIRNLGDEDNLSPISYSLPRMDKLDEKYPGIKNMPETGYIFGKRVENLKEWADVLVNSDQFAANTVKDYWMALIGQDPAVQGQAEFKQLWTDFKGKHNFSVDAMLRDLIKTKAFGAP